MTTNKIENRESGTGNQEPGKTEKKKQPPRKTAADKLKEAIANGRTSICPRCGHRGKPGDCDQCGTATVVCDKSGAVEETKTPQVTNLCHPKPETETTTSGKAAAK